MTNSSIRVGNDGSLLISGSMTFNSTPVLYRELESRFQSKGQLINIDLAGVEHADSSGLALLLEWQAMANRQSGRLHVTNAPDNLLRLAKLCEADVLLDISGREFKHHASG
jgi:phospholipid transport system transporter-binding protein